uniref:Uncharacterized protein n=2 Tax=Emiliania huxleyi TaxID=2903 RepID=A0A6V2U253_EMIHU
MESDKAHGARWELVRLAPSRIVFDVHRHVSRGCHANDTAGISVIGCVVNHQSGGLNWRWAKMGQIGHAAQILYKCWSFLSHFAGDPALHNSTRLLIARHAPARPIYDFLPTRFSRELMRAMGLRSYYGGSLFAAPSFEPALGAYVRCVKLWAVPSRTIYPGSSSVFFARASDPWRLVAAVTGRQLLRPLLAAGAGRGRSDGNGLLDGEARTPPSAALRLGFLARGPSREGESREWPHVEALIIIS